MRVFLSEYLTCAALPLDGDVRSTLAVEGAAILRAVAADAAAVPGWHVTVAWDAALEPFGVAGVEVRPVRSHEEEVDLFAAEAARADVTLALAPEFDGLLADRRRMVDAAGGRFSGPSPEAIDLCGDKLRLAEHFESRRVPTIETRPFDAVDAASGLGPRGLVVKPRHGAGSVETFHVTDAETLVEAATAFSFKGGMSEPVMQPFVPGQSLSVAAVVSGRGVEVSPVGRQRIVGTTRLHYAGGTIPAETGRDDEVARAARAAIESVPGLLGYMGVDLLLPDDDSPPVVVEINPRLTTSYLGYRRIAVGNLAERLLDFETPRPPLAWRTDAVEFLPDGTVRERT